MATRTANEAATYFQAFHYWAQQVSHNAIRHVYGKAILTVWLVGCTVWVVNPPPSTQIVAFSNLVATGPGLRTA